MFVPVSLSCDSLAHDAPLYTEEAPQIQFLYRIDTREISVTPAEILDLLEHAIDTAPVHTLKRCVAQARPQGSQCSSTSSAMQEFRSNDPKYSMALHAFHTIMEVLRGAQGPMEVSLRFWGPN